MNDSSSMSFWSRLLCSRAHANSKLWFTILHYNLLRKQQKSWYLQIKHHSVERCQNRLKYIFSNQCNHLPTNPKRVKSLKLTISLFIFHFFILPLYFSSLTFSVSSLLTLNLWKQTHSKPLEMKRAQSVLANPSLIDSYKCLCASPGS